MAVLICLINKTGLTVMSPLGRNLTTTLTGVSIFVKTIRGCVRERVEVRLIIP